MASRKIQATLSERSSARVDQIQLTYLKMGSELADSAAVNALIEILCNVEAENIELETQLRMNHIMKEGAK